MGFDYQWTAPNGVQIVVQTVSFPDGQRQLVGVYQQGASPPIVAQGTGWATIAANVIGRGADGTRNVSLEYGDTAARVDSKQKAGYVFYYYDGAPSFAQPGQTIEYTKSGGSPQLVNVTSPSAYEFDPGWYARSSASQISATAQAQMQAYQWGVQQLASMGTTASSVAGNPTAGSTVAQNVPPPAPGAPPASHLMTYLLLGAAAVGGYFLLKPASSSSSSSAAA
jgi:hypothetical protein